MKNFEVRCENCNKKTSVISTEDDLNTKNHSCGNKIYYNEIKFFDLNCDKCGKTFPVSITDDQLKDLVQKPHENCGGKLSYNEMNVEFIMATHWDKHWDKLENGETYYTRGKIKIGLPIERIVERKESAEVIFLKRKEENILEIDKAWKGSIDNFNIREGTTVEGKKYPQLWFNVNIEGEIIVPAKYCKKENGWWKVEPKIDNKQKTIEDAWT